MHGIAKRGLALAAATSGLVLGTAGIAAAAATATGNSTNSGGIASGNVVNGAVSLPANVCGNQALVLAVRDIDSGQLCNIGAGEGAVAEGSSLDSGGIGSGNVVNGAVAAPINACGNQVGVGAVEDADLPSTCTVGTNGEAPGAIATGSSSNSPGILSGNVVGLALSAPVNACGNQVDVLGALNTDDRQTCIIR